MQKVTTINLNGRAFQLEEAGFAALDSYLKQAAERLHADPDKDEIMADLEQAMAEKCQRCLNVGKDVVTAEEVARIIDEMGPVNAPGKTEPDSGTGEAAAHGGGHGNGNAPKRLYKIRDGAMLAGVCAGLAAYFEIDVTFVRLLFVALTLLTHGPWVLVYIILALVVPYANTAEERAAAHGAPFNAKEIVERAKAVGKESLENGKAWHKKWKAKAEAWHKKHKEEERQWHEARTHHHGSARQQARAEARRMRSEARQFRADAQEEYAAHIWFRSSTPLLGIISAALTVLWIVAVIQLVTSGAVFGFVIPANIPLWVALLGLIILYNFVVWPIRAARMVGYEHAWQSHEYDRYGWFGMLDGLMWLAVLGICGWFAYVYVPVVHQFADRLPEAARRFVEAMQR